MGVSGGWGRPVLADGAMLAVAVIWAGNNIIVKAALAEIAPLPYVLSRFVIVVALLFTWLGLAGTLRRPSRDDAPLFLLAGFSGYALYNVLFTVGLDRTSAFSVAILISLGPVFTLLFAALIGMETVRWRQWVGIAAATAGVAIFVGDKLQGDAPAIGDALSLFAAASFAVYSLSTRPLVARYGAPSVTAWSALVGLIAVVPLALPATWEQNWAEVSSGAWAALIYSSAISMLLAYTMWAWAIDRRGIGRTVPYLYLVPILTGAFAALFLGEVFGPLKVGGALLVLVGVGLVRGFPLGTSRRSRHERRGEAPQADGGPASRHPGIRRV